MSDLIKKFTSTAIAIVILIVVAGYFLLFEKGATEKEKQQSSLFPELIKEDISSIHITYPDTTIMLSKLMDDWYLIRDANKYKADIFAMDTIVDALVDLKSETEVSKSDDDLAQYGLRSPRAIITAETSGSRYSYSLGTESPVGSGVYLKKGDSAGVMLADSSLVWPFLDRKFNDLRDKEIINLDEEAISEVRFQTVGFDQIFNKQDGKWQGEGLAEFIEINHLKIEGIVRSFSDLRVVGFETDDPGKLSRYELDKPSAILTITEDEKEYDYLFGSRKEDTDYYMKLSGRPSVYLVSSYNYEQLPKSINDLRIKKLLGMDEDSVRSIKIKNNSNLIDLKKVNNMWTIDNYEGQVDGVKVSELISYLAGLEVSEFADDSPSDLGKYGLQTDNMSITINDDPSMSLIIGKEKNGFVYTKKTDKKSTYLIESNILSMLPKSIEDLLVVIETDHDVIFSLPEQ